LADDIIITRPPPSERSLDPGLLLSIALELKKDAKIDISPENALKHALELARDADLVCVAGSLYLIGEIKKVFQNRKGL
jgi:dihydrofolate synthase / folylpolyglutamate synthase